MNNFDRDIKEIIMFMNCTDVSDHFANSDICLARISEKTDDDYLMLRTEVYNNAFMGNPEFLAALNKASYFCENEACKSCPINKYCNHFITGVRKKSNQNMLNMVDLFCGAGGLSLGFTQEGFRTILANDIEECCIDTYAHNHPETSRSKIVLGDIKNVIKDIDQLIGNENVDVVVGGPPCQGFSMANRQRIIDDPRNRLYKNFVEVVSKVKPVFFVMENVKGMLSVANQVVEDFKKIGYDTRYKVLNARDYGVPQNRERLIYIGNRKGIDNQVLFDRLNELKTSCVLHNLGDALYGLRPLVASRIKNSTESGSQTSGHLIEKNLYLETNDYIRLINRNQEYGYVLNHQARYNNDRDIEIFGRLNPGDRSDDPKIADIMPYANRNDIFKDKYYKLDCNKVCKTITAHMKFDCNMYIHPSQARGLTPREAARVQSYPDDYFFRGPYTKTYMQIGNSVPPLLGRAVAAVVRQYIERED